LVRCVLAEVESDYYPSLWKAMIFVLDQKYPEINKYDDLVFDKLPSIGQYDFKEVEYADAGTKPFNILTNPFLKMKGIWIERELDLEPNTYENVARITIDFKRWNTKTYEVYTERTNVYIVRENESGEFEIEDVTNEQNV